MLLIEDEPAVMAYVRLRWNAADITSSAANRAPTALRLLEIGAFLGVVSDMRDARRRQRRHVHAWIASHRPDLASRLVFITGDIANEETVETLRETGAPCVEKPFRVQQLKSSQGRSGRPMGKTPIKKIFASAC